MIDLALGPESRLAEEAHLDLHLLSRVALGSHLRRAGVAQELLDRQLGERRIVPPDLRLLGVLEAGTPTAVVRPEPGKAGATTARSRPAPRPRCHAGWNPLFVEVAGIAHRPKGLHHALCDGIGGRQPGVRVERDGLEVTEVNLRVPEGHGGAVAGADELKDSTEHEISNPIDTKRRFQYYSAQG